MASREEILRRVASAKVVPVRASRSEVEPSTRSREEILEQFADYVADYKANVYQVKTADLGVKIQDLAGIDPVLVPTDLPEAWSANILTFPDTNLTIQEIDRYVCVLTGSAVGVAETGSIVLDSGPGQGRRAISLIPDHHICVVKAEDVVDSISEAVERLKEAVNAGRPLTWISGPSATSDIELNRVEGVHGPRKLDVIIAFD